MIYSFDRGDPNQEKLLALLQRAGLDYEIIEKDGVVVHVLGAIASDLQAQLQSNFHGRKAVPSPCYAEIIERKEPIVIAGPCAVESEEQLAQTTAFLAELGIKYLRGGAFKPRTSPMSFQGLGKTGLRLLAKYTQRYGLKIVTEVMDRSHLDLVREYADIIQVGMRNMFNYSLLVALGAVDKPILLKRSMSATIKEWMAAAEYISRGGNRALILCERGIRTFEPLTRNTLDIAAVPLAKKLTGYPVIADPSHAAGRADLVPALALAALAAGADGVMIEIHPQPQQALSDEKQALTFAQFKDLLQKIRQLNSLHMNLNSHSNWEIQ